jgi:hypothetical protein
MDKTASVAGSQGAWSALDAMPEMAWQRVAEPAVQVRRWNAEQ